MGYGHWQIELVGEFVPTEWFGFIYLIENNTNGKKYIGKKQFCFKKTKQQHKKKYTILVESDWKTYIGSSQRLIDDITTLGKECFSFTILELCSGKSQLSYLEECYQYRNNVLFERFDNGEPKFYNKTIAHRHFAGVEKQSIESRERIKVSLQKYHTAHPGSNTRTEESRKRISDSIKLYMAALPPEKRKKCGNRHLLSREERKKQASYARSFLPKESQQRGGHISGERHKTNKTGICGLSDLDKHKARSAGGKVTGNLLWWTDGQHSKRAMLSPGENWKPGRTTWVWSKNISSRGYSSSSSASNVSLSSASKSSSQSSSSPVIAPVSLPQNGQ